MQHVSARKWPEAAWVKTKKQIGLHSGNFRVCSANFRVCSFREFPRLFLAHLYSKHFTMSQFTHKQGCKSMPEVAQSP